MHVATRYRLLLLCAFWITPPALAQLWIKIVVRFQFARVRVESAQGAKKDLAAHAQVRLLQKTRGSAG